MDPEEETPVIAQIRKIGQMIKQHPQYLSENLLNHFLQNIHQYGSSYIIFLLHHHYIHKIGPAFQTTHPAFKNNHANLMAHLFKHLLTIFDQFTPQFTNLSFQSISQFIESNNCDDITNCLQKNGEERATMRWVQNYLKKKDNFTSQQIHDYIEGIEQELKSTQFGENNVYDEMLLNWLRVELEQQRCKVEKEAKNKLCCKLNWSYTENITSSDEMYLQFKKFTYPFQKNLEFTLKKIMIAFLNTKGGIAFIGVDKKQATGKQAGQGAKKLNIIGMALAYNLFPEIYNTFVKLLEDIYPKHQGFPSKKARQTSQFLIRDRLKMPINDYISIEFSPIINLKTLENQRRQGKVLYILKLYVKEGHPRHFYHLVNKEKSLEFFIRKKSQDGKMLTINKIKVPEGLNIASKKAEEYRNKNEMEMKMQRKNFHENCYFSVEVPQLEKVKDEGFEDFDSDDDFF